MPHITKDAACFEESPALLAAEDSMGMAPERTNTMEVSAEKRERLVHFQSFFSPWKPLPGSNDVFNIYGFSSSSNYCFFQSIAL